MSLKLKIIWIVVCALAGFGIYVILTFPRDIQTDSVLQFRVTPEEVRCVTGRRRNSPNWVSIVGKALPRHSFWKEGACSQIRNDLLFKNVEVYLYKPVTYMGRYVAIELRVDQRQYLKLDDFRRSYLGFVVLIFMVAPCLVAGVMTYGPFGGRVSASAAVNA